jgi:hypothetical protein
VRAGFIHAVAFLSEMMLTERLALTLSEQLSRNFPGFAGARERFHKALTESECGKLDSLQRDVIGPLQGLGKGQEVRMA